MRFFGGDMLSPFRPVIDASRIAPHHPAAQGATWCPHVWLPEPHDWGPREGERVASLSRLAAPIPFGEKPRSSAQTQPEPTKTVHLRGGLWGAGFVAQPVCWCGFA